MKLGILSIVLCAAFLQGCILSPSINSIQKAGLTESGRKDTLNDAVKEFQTALFWENFPKAQGYASELNGQDVMAQLKQKRNEGRLVDSKVENVTFTDDAYKAKVDVSVRVKDDATNIVNSKNEEQSWIFSVYDGWKIDSIAKKIES